MAGRLAGKVMIVTGASRGIGQAIAKSMAQEGAVVVGVARGDMEETGGVIAKAQGRFAAFVCDFENATPERIHELVEQILERFGRIDGLINNAGIIRRAPAAEYSAQDWAAVLQVNLNVPFYLSQAIARWWLGRGRGLGQGRLKIVNIASLLSFQGGITVPAYAASKHGLAGLTKALANEWAKERINVNAIAPGYIATDNTQALRDNPPRAQAILDRIPEGRWGEPVDIAGACVFLASLESDYINGSILNVDGGWLAR